MKITKAVIRKFEQTQQEHGTKTAISNLLWELASDLLKDIGVVSTKTVYGSDKSN